MLYIVLAVLSGFSVIFSRILNANMALKIGIYQGTFMNYVAGLSLSLLLIMLIPTGYHISSGIPIWAFFGGTLGVLVIALSSYITHRISNFNLTLIIFFGQLATGVIIDLFMGKSISKTKMMGGLLIFIGLAYNILVDRSESKVTASR